MNITDEEIRIKVAEAMGWEVISDTLCNVKPDKNGDPEIEPIAPLPNYPADLNACAEFEKTLTDEEQASYVLFLNTQHPISDILYPDQTERGFPKKLAGEVFGLVSATARQRCIAYLKVKGILP